MNTTTKTKFKQTEVGTIPEYWVIFDLGEVADISTGFPFEGRKYSDKGIKVLRGENVSVGFLRWDTEKRWNHSLEGLDKYQLSDSDIVIGMDGSKVGQNRARIKNSDLPLLLAQRVARVRAKPPLDQGYLYYVIFSDKFFNHVEAVRTGTSIPHISSKQIGELRLAIPPLSEQNYVAKILSDLDSKIELNQQTNRTFEEMGRAIFKGWFVDFEFPNEEGKPYKSSGGKTKDSELGEIPEEWDVRTVGDIMELAYGKALRDDIRRHGPIPVFGSNGQIGWHDEKIIDGPGIIVGRKGNPGVVKWSQTAFFPIDTTFYVVPKHLIRSMHYLFYALQFQNLHSLGADSAVPGLNRNIVYTNKLLVPSPKILEAFDSRIRILYAKIHVNDEQSRVLTEIRDSLLPKLMSGKIRVPVEAR